MKNKSPRLIPPADAVWDTGVNGALEGSLWEGEDPLNERALTTRRILNGVLALSLSLTACTPGGVGKKSIDTDDPRAPCKVFSKSDMRSVANIPPQNNGIVARLWRDRPPISGLYGMQYCLYTDRRGSLTSYVGLSTYSRDAERFARSSFQKWRREESRELKRAGGNLRPIKEIGDQAFWTGGPNSGHLVIMQGSRILTISMSGEQRPALERAKVLAAKGLERL